MLSKLPWATAPAQEENAKPSSSSTAAPEKEQSLTTILTTPEHRTELLLLIANCTEALRQNVVDTFDPERTNPRLPKLPPKPDQSEDAVEKTAEELQAAEDAEKQRVETEHQRRIKELASPAMLALKKSALAHFDGWRDRVVGRVGGAINEKPPEAGLTSGTAQPAESREMLDEMKEAHGHETIETLDQNDIRDLADLYPPQDTALSTLSEPKRVLILHSMLLLLLSLERYSAESRILLLQIATSLHLPLSTLTTDESKVAQGLLEAAQQQISADSETKKAQDASSVARKWKVGLGAVAGAAIIGVTGGLAAPLLAAGVGSVMGGLGLGTTVAATYLGALAGSAPLVGVLFGAYGGSMTSKVMDQYARAVEDFAFLPIKSHRGGIFHEKYASTGDDKENRRLRVAIGVSGWLASQDDIVKPWHVISSNATEAFALRWELEALMKLGNALTTYIKSAAWSLAKKEIISRTLFGALMAGLWPLGLLKVGEMIDNPFSIGKLRADKAGAVMAEALINHVQGERPVTLVGYSLGARLIYSCLQTLAVRHAFGLVENVVLLGAPTPSDSVNWRKMRSVVAGRVVNVFSTKDYLLAFLYRTSSLQLGVAGLQEVMGVVGVENVDVSELVDGHTKYRLLTAPILKQIGLEDIDLEEAERQAAQEEKEEAEEAEERKRKEANGEEDPAEMEKEVAKKNEQGMMGWMSQRMSAIGIGGGGAKNEAAKGDAGGVTQAGAQVKEETTNPPPAPPALAQPAPAHPAPARQGSSLLD